MIKNIDKEFQINTDFLNTIDFIPFLTKYQRLGQMMEELEKVYNNSNMPNELKGEIFNYYSEEDFKNYLLDRYSHIRLYTIIDYLIGFESR